jgi:hypothetical protein
MGDKATRGINSGLRITVPRTPSSNRWGSEHRAPPLGFAPSCSSRYRKSAPAGVPCASVQPSTPRRAASHGLPGRDSLADTQSWGEIEVAQNHVVAGRQPLGEDLELRYPPRGAVRIEVDGMDREIIYEHSLPALPRGGRRAADRFGHGSTPRAQHLHPETASQGVRKLKGIVPAGESRASALHAGGRPHLRASDRTVARCAYAVGTRLRRWIPGGLPREMGPRLVRVLANARRSRWARRRAF